MHTAPDLREATISSAIAKGVEPPSGFHPSAPQHRNGARMRSSVLLCSVPQGTDPTHASKMVGLQGFTGVAGMRGGGGRSDSCQAAQACIFPATLDTLSTDLTLFPGSWETQNLRRLQHPYFTLSLHIRARLPEPPPSWIFDS